VKVWALRNTDRQFSSFVSSASWSRRASANLNRLSKPAHRLIDSCQHNHRVECSHQKPQLRNPHACRLHNSSVEAAVVKTSKGARRWERSSGSIAGPAGICGPDQQKRRKEPLGRSRLGSYEITAQIGAGGMGEVYRARDTRLKRDVALKILPETFAADPDRLARFQREAEVLASLSHPNIAAIYGLEEADGVKALVMELVEGEDLSQRISRGPIPLDEALPIARQIAEALEAAHEQGIVHRDLKPANIKVTAALQIQAHDHHVLIEAVVRSSVRMQDLHRRALPQGIRRVVDSAGLCQGGRDGRRPANPDGAAALAGQPLVFPTRLVSERDAHVAPEELADVCLTSNCRRAPTSRGTSRCRRQYFASRSSACPKNHRHPSPSCDASLHEYRERTTGRVFHFTGDLY
jgi:Protein kinase domain